MSIKDIHTQKSKQNARLENKQEKFDKGYNENLPMKALKTPFKTKKEN